MDLWAEKYYRSPCFLCVGFNFGGVPLVGASAGPPKLPASGTAGTKLLTEIDMQVKLEVRTG